MSDLQAPLPSFDERAFVCPHCGVLAVQITYNVYGSKSGYHNYDVPDLNISTCTHCRKYIIWKDEKVLYPDQSSAPMPSPDLPENIKADYMEARSILSRSPRGAAALLRLCIQKLCKHLGEKGERVNDDIGNLVKNGLDPRIQKCLDIVRVVGNNAVHPGELDVKDNHNIAGRLFELINVIVKEAITRPKELDDLYLEIPEGARKQIEKRDDKAS